MRLEKFTAKSGYSGKIDHLITAQIDHLKLFAQLDLFACAKLIGLLVMLFDWRNRILVSDQITPNHIVYRSVQNALKTRT